MEQLQYTPQDFKSDAQIRWCPGCGDIAIIKAVQTAFAKMGRPREEFVLVSGIGCSSRFPYYMNTYGFHTIHGRAGAVATGVKLANPNLSVWQITGDGDALAIGGNHFIHEIRRNIDIKVLLFNNKIYGLTKGQYSPTSVYGQITKSSPYGTVEEPFNPGTLSIAAGTTFFARSFDVNVDQNVDIILEMEKHKGIAIFEILQNCVIFNDGAHNYYTDREFKEERQVYVKHGEPMIFGKNRDKGLILDENNRLKVVKIGEKIGEKTITEKDILIHNAHNEDPILHYQLARLEDPIVTGVIRMVEKPTFEKEVENQIKNIKEKLGISKKSDREIFEELIFSGNVWEVK